ncbi:hypothetical protein [Desulfurococcus mucosus]|uniref:Uncharacterized protein n=1 Tax=Desulfurococcus mucosus (strain ATCC 35584 / DSM 2162 / JCM 9187 / O7/1) TaxID=765177 RepID=E8R8R0_DESM0|nr:hypothetical protein [Desulfurococcus mucosus]ADV64886.1 hypothetical protein Desmu_0577 [Desulfurococcus mucosus DSM 2162]
MNGLLELVGLLAGSFVSRDYEEEPVKITVTVQGITVFIEDGFVELAKGSEHIVPRWVARELAAKGYATITEDGIDKERLAKLLFLEDRYKSQPRFEELKGYFYRRLGEKIKETLEEHGKSRDLRRLEELSESVKMYRDALVSLTRLRAKKIVGFLTAPGYPAEAVNNLSLEEKIFFNSLRTLLDTYFKVIIGVDVGEPGK